MKIIQRSLIGMGMLMLWTAGAVADDGTIFRKNISDTPAYDTEFVSQRMLPLYVPPQNSDGTLLTSITYTDADGGEALTSTMVRPLIGTYQDGPVEFIEAYEAFPGHGARDAYAAVSLDDGATWKRTNLSNSAKRSSIKINGEPYPGDTLRNFAASDGNKVLFVWVSKYCDIGSPNYAMTETERSAVAAQLVATGRITDTGMCTDNDPLTPCLYLEDIFGVAGSQGVQSAEDLAEEGYPLVGDYPYSCLWAARGSLQPGLNGEPSRFVWFKAERLTSGVRSAERAETVCVKGAGCVVTWQEDPDGVRPGHGDGPGEGWSGAIAYHQTDKWYSYIAWDDFDLVSADGTYGSIQTLPDYLAAATKIGSPKAAIPMAMPVRVTDNAMCVKEKDEAGNTVESDDPYCYADFNGNVTSDFCATTVDVIIETPEGPTSTVAMCVTEDDRLMRGNTASTRARLSLHGYSTLGDYKADPIAYPINSAWVSFTYEENKGLGDICDDGDCVELTDADKRDMGKNVWYHTFAMFQPEVVSQGLMLNQPSVYPADWADPTGLLVKAPLFEYNFWAFDADPIYETQAGLATTTLYQSEIARRPSHVTQDWYDAGPSGLVAFNLWKQGIIRRGGPADIMARRWVLPAVFNPATDNPYDYKNMVCETLGGASAWAFRTDLGQEANPRYVKGLCAAPAINLSGNTVLTGADCTDAAACLDVFPFNDYFDDLAGGLPISEILTWQQYGPGYGETITDPVLTSLDDQSWENPYDMAKGHRGFLTGDMVMVMYAWTNNWRALTEGHDIVNLYVRRSFDGGKTWSTLPASFAHTNGLTYDGDGTTTCEFMGPTGSATEYPVCTTYAAGVFEQARDLSLLVGTNVTVLDPRYSPTTRSITTTSVGTANLPAGFLAPDCTAIDGACDNMRDPSRFFAVFETGIPSAYDEGEAEPLDLFYSRAVDWGDDYLVWQDVADTSACLPSSDSEDPYDLDGFCNEFDALEGSQLSEASEAAVTSSPGGQFMYSMWYQHDFDNLTGAEIGADAWFRRVMFLDNYVPGGDDGTDPPIEPPAPPEKTPPGQAKK